MDEAIFTKSYRKDQDCDAKDAVSKRKEPLTEGLSRILKKRMIKVLVWPVVLYGCKICMIITIR